MQLLNLRRLFCKLFGGILAIDLKTSADRAYYVGIEAGNLAEVLTSFRKKIS
jgi:hypothetical protein